MHLLYTLGVSFTLIDVVLLLNMRTVVLSLQRKFAAYRMFVAMERELRDKYPSLSGDELPAEGNAPVLFSLSVLTHFTYGAVSDRSVCDLPRHDDGCEAAAVRSSVPSR